MAEQPKWIEEPDSCRLGIYGNRERLRHYFDVTVYNKPKILRKLTEENRHQLGWVQCRGVLEDTEMDTILEISKTNEVDLLLVGGAWFNQGKFVYGQRVTRFSPGGGFGDGIDIRTIQDFRDDLKGYFMLPSFSPIKSFLNSPGLPDRYREAIAEILK